MVDMIEFLNSEFWNSGLPVTCLFFSVLGLMFVVFGPPWRND